MTGRFFILLAVFFAVHFGVVVPAQADELWDDLRAIRADPEPEALVRDATYFISNESEQYLYKDILVPAGGMYIGIGGEQNYLFIGWREPEVVVLFDFDQNIVDMHNIYALFFQESKTPDELLNWWKKGDETKKKVYELIDTHHSDKKLRKRLKFIYRSSRALVYRRLKWLKRTYKKKGVPTFLTDQKQYDTVVSLFTKQRLVSVRGDLTKERTMHDISQLATKHKLLVKTAYFSNAEYYFTYRAGNFRNNVNELPADDTSYVLNTIARTNTEYYYIYTPIPLYKKWVSWKKMKNLLRLRKYYAKQLKEDVHLYAITSEPPVSKPSKGGKKGRKSPVQKAGIVDKKSGE